MALVRDLIQAVDGMDADGSWQIDGGLYLSGPINSPVPTLSPLQCRRNFNEVRDHIDDNYIGRYTAVSPVDLPNPGRQFANPADAAKEAGRAGDLNSPDALSWMRQDIAIMMLCEGIVMLPGWTYSWGAHIELEVAQALKFEVRFAHNNGEGWFLT